MAEQAERVTFLGSERFSVAPMVDVTDSVFRRFARIMTKRAMLYTEMIADEALAHNKLHLIRFSGSESPVCLQIGGSDPKKLALAVRHGVDAGYAAFNLNAGCPSDKVQSGRFGACLMRTPEIIAQGYAAMQEAAGDLPVSVKTRIGVDELDSEEFTFRLMRTIYDAGCRHIIIHARKAWLNGLSPKENRTVPPLDYERVYRIREEFKDLRVTINGGILTLDECEAQLERVDGVMLGRAIIDNPYLLASVDRRIFNDDAPVKTREEVLTEVIELAGELEREGIPLHLMIRHVTGLFAGCPNAKLFRRHISERMSAKGMEVSVLRGAYEAMRRGAL